MAASISDPLTNSSGSLGSSRGPKSVECQSAARTSVQYLFMLDSMGNNTMNLILCLVLLSNGIFALAQQNTESQSLEEEDPLLHSLHSVLIGKMSEAKNAVLHGSPAGHIPVLDPFKMEPLTLTVQEPKGFVNVSLRKMFVEGLGNFQLRDIVTNLDVLRTSVLLRFPEIRVKGTYKLKGFLNPPFSQSLTDEGMFEAKVNDAMATWIGRIEHKEPDTDSSILSLSQASFRTYWEAASHTFTSFLKKNEGALEKAGELLQAVSSAVIEKVQRLAEEGLEQAIAHVMGRSKQTSWFEMYPPLPADTTSTVIDPDFELLESDTSPFVEESEYKSEDEPTTAEREGRSSRRKRQVPCENGEGLDEYVDTLLRFGRRLIRFQEPIPFPNTTVKIDDMLTVFLYNGGVRGASNLSRRKNAYVKCTNTSTTLGLVVRLENLRVNVKYRVLQDYRLLLFNGDGDIRIREVIVLVQLTQFTTPSGETRQRLDRLKIWKLGHVTVRLRGLGNLTSALAMLLTYQINEDPKAVIPVAEAQVTHVIRQQLNNVTIPIFSII
ncbi:uncharacterized protein LOC118185845 isoform X2 [Stegodyphus dumicola]|uniref:uncharacterized protein LOC118185845 isoform X2 n=1 Tax=Stegodyphus dumicola TaxID=202533 RepID=UPI0015B163E2|nr:uncharacterized protein LOC118185845 isoform X2 [Stegodyphus dumicola]